MKMVSTKVRIAAVTYFETISDGNDGNKSEGKKVILKERKLKRENRRNEDHEADVYVDCGS